MPDVKPRITEESNDKSKIWKLTEISESSQCRSLKLPENMRVTKVHYSIVLLIFCLLSFFVALYLCFLFFLQYCTLKNLPNCIVTTR